MEWLQPDGNPWPRVPVERDELEACYSLETQLACGRFSSVWEAQAIRKPGEAPTARVSVKVTNVVAASPDDMSSTTTGVWPSRTLSLTHAFSRVRGFVCMCNAWSGRKSFSSHDQHTLGAPNGSRL